jgi:lipopolysaccharide cholinephosphotransferase
MMNELQKVELDLFRCFAETCEKLNLNYFLVCGSALGAARHGGFIPWDDDMDVGMYREDYDKFMELAPAILPEGIFLQNYKSDPEFPYIFAKLRNSNTTYIEKLLSNFDINHGIYMDIFPLDGYPNDLSEQKKLASMKRNYRRKLFCGFKMPRDFKAAALAFVLRMLGYHKRTAKTLAQYEALITSYSVKDSTKICSHGTWYGERDYISVEYYGKGTDAVYEGLKVRVPEKCDEYLTSLYGEWRTPPAPEKQKGTHQYEICDTERPYTDYLKNK